MEIKIDHKIKLVLKVIVSILLISLAVYFAGPAMIWKEVKGIKTGYLIPIFVMALLNVAISAKKWHILLKAKGEDSGYLYVWRMYFIGKFFNLFLPTDIGGDIIKAREMSKITRKSVDAYSSVFMERFTGLVAVFCLAVIASSLFIFEMPLIVLAMIYMILLPILLILSALLFNKNLVKRFRGQIEKIFSYFNPFSLRERSIKLYVSINQYAKEKRAVYLSLLIAFIYHPLLIFVNYMLALSIGINVPIHYFFIFIPLTSILLILPISIKGFGVREVIYAYFFTQVGATTAQSVSLSLLYQFVVVIISLIGGFVFLYHQIETI